MNGQREHWGSRVGFILAAAGSAIGLGNIWRFPFVTGTNGGAAFVVIYLIAIIFIGYPLMVSEITLGRKSQKNPIGAFLAIAPNSPWWIVGALGVFAGFLILSYYSVVAGWAVAYIFKALAGFTMDMDFGTMFYRTIGVDLGDGLTNIYTPILWHAVFMILTLSIIAAGVVKGIQRWVKILMPLLFVLLVALVLRAVTLPGAGAGITFYLRPDFSAITGRTFLAAIAQSFFTLSLGMGAMITYGSYLSSSENIGDNAAWVVGLDTAVAIIAGFAIFPAVFALGLEPGQGPGLTFVTLPAVFAQMPAGAFFGFLFFLLLAVAALTSAISLLEVVVAWLVDEKGWPRVKASLIIGVIIFIVGIPASLGYSVLGNITFLGLDVLDTYDWWANSIILPLGGLLTAIFVGYVWTAKKAQEYSNDPKGKIYVGDWYGFLIKYVVPAAIIIVMFFGLWDTFTG